MNTVRSRSRRQKAREHMSAGQWPAAERILRELCSLERGNAENWFLLAAVCGQTARYDEAITCGKMAVGLAPTFAEAHYNLAQAFMHRRRYAEAVESYRTFLKLNPKHAAAFNALGLALDNLGKTQEAFQCYRESVRLSPEQADAWHNGGNAALTLGYRDDGIRFLRRAIELRPNAFASHVCLGNALVEAGELEGAHAAFACAAVLDPSHADPVVGEAAILEKRGDYAAAWGMLEPYRANGYRGGRFAVTYAAVASRIDRHTDAIAVLSEAIQAEAQRGGAGPSLHFALGELYDRVGDFDRAFEQFAQANRLVRATSGEDSYLKAMADTQQRCTRAFFSRAPRARSSPCRPIFIVGMPRSGTTLAEQIVASHPAVCAGGELTEIADIAEWLGPLADANRPGPEILVDPARLNVAARRYADRLSKVCPSAPRVTDKMPHNFLHLGLIALLFPDARIVHCRRNPVDTCFSIFTHEFSAAHGYAADLRQLGKHYCAYIRLMRHWRDVLPLAIFDLSYETLVANQEATTRDLLDFLDLEWDDRCLRFHENKRVVSTPSYDQVRRPLYQSSVARWRHYEKFLAPLVEELGSEAEP